MVSLDHVTVCHREQADKGISFTDSIDLQGDGINSEMSLQAPSWINAEFLQRVLKKSTNVESLEVKSVVTKYATAKGDNYLSDIIRAMVEYTHDNSGAKVTKKVSLIIKVAPTSVTDKKIALEFGAFETEIKMMETTLGKINKMLNEEGCRISAHVLYTEKGDSPLLVLEDLATLGYRLTDRQAGLDLEHSILVIRKLAMLHATSVALWEKDPQSMTTYKKGIYHKESPEDVKKLFRDGLKVLGNQVLNWPELGSSGPSYSDKLLKASKGCYEKGIELCAPKEGAFHVLVHGDAWANNLLFRYNKDGKVEDLIFVDFQMSLWSSPAVDILYFMNTSISEHVELHDVDNLLEEYLNVLTKTMSKLGCRTKPPNMTELRRSLEEHEFLAVLTSSVSFSLIVVDKSQAMRLDEIMQQGDDYVSPAYTNPAYCRRMQRRLIAWNSRGVIDV